MAMQIVDDGPKCWESLPVELKLDIIDLLPLSDVSRLSRINKATFNMFIDLIYRRDSVENNSSAIFRAAELCSIAQDPYTMGRVLARSLYNGGDVDARHEMAEAWSTPLHVAAANGSAPITSMLLAAGADVMGLGRVKKWGGPNVDMWQTLRTFNRDLMCVMFSQTLWYPLLVPFLMGYHDVIHVLLRAGASGDLAVEYEDRGERSLYIGTDQVGEMRRGITVHHVFAASEEGMVRQDRDGSCLFARFHDGIDVKLPAVGSTPLHLALDSPRSFAFESLLQAGADIEVANAAGRTVLLQACVNFSRAQGGMDFIKRCRFFIDALLASGADVNHLQGLVEPASPLMALVRYEPLQCDVPIAMWKEVVHDLISHGLTGQAINARPFRISALEMLWRTMNDSWTSPTLLRAKQTVMQRLVVAGGNLNQPSITGSILQIQIIRFQMRPRSLLLQLLRLGARLDPQSVDVVFLHWLSNGRLQAIEEFDMWSYKDQISQRQIEDAFMIFFTGYRNSAFDMLEAKFPGQMPAERLVRKMLKRPMKRLNTLPVLPEFDPGYITSSGRSFLHILVDYALRYRSSSVMLAIANAKFFISQGVSTRIVDERGRSALDFLANAPARLRPLKRYLTGEFEKERRKFEAQEPQPGGDENDHEQGGWHDAEQNVDGAGQSDDNADESSS